MKLVLLPGLDGTGLLFEPLLEALPATLRRQVVTSPTDRKLTLHELADHVEGQLPQDEDYVLLAESFSGLVALALVAEKQLQPRGLIFCASFATPPATLK